MIEAHFPSVWRSPTGAVMALAIVAGAFATVVPSRAEAQSAAVAPWPRPEQPSTQRDTPTDAGAPRRAASGVEVDVSAATVVPLYLGAQANLELPARILLQGEIGVLPGAYVDTVDAILTGSDAYGSAESEIVRAGLRNSLVARLSGGFRPFEEHGFEVFGGYTMISLGTSVTARDAVESATDTQLPAAIGNENVDVDATLHAVHGSAGWRWVIADHVAIRTSVGYVHAVSASSTVAVPESFEGAAPAGAVAEATSAAEARLDDLLTSYGKLPVVGVSVGYRF